MIVECFF